MSGKIVLLVLVLIVAASGVSVGLQATGGGVNIPAVRQLGSTTPSIIQTEDVQGRQGTLEATESIAMPDSTDCFPLAATPETTVEGTPAATEEAAAISSTFVVTPTPACLPIEATPDFAFTPEATPDVFIATPDATEDSDDRGRGRGRGGDDSGDDDHSGRSGRGGDDHSGRGDD